MIRLKGLLSGGLSLLFLIGLTQLSYAEVPWIKYSYSKNFGGLSDQLSTTEIEDNEATDIQNVIFDVGGALKKRFGFDTLGSGAIKISTGTTIGTTGLAFYKKNNGDRFLVGVVNRDSNVTVKKKNFTTGSGPVTGAWDTIDGAVSDATYSNNNLCDFAVAEDNIVFTIGEQYTPFMWTGSNHAVKLTADTDVPNATMVEYHKNHLFLAGNSTNPSRVYFSALDDITTYTATDFFDVQTSDGSQVRALISAYDSLYIFKDRSIWRLSGWERDTFRLEKLVDGVGTLSNNCVVATNSGIYFVSSQNDVFHYDGAYTTTNISRKISQTTSGTNRQRAQYILGLAYSTYKYVDTDYYIATPIGSATEHDQVLLFDTNFKAWTKFKGFAPLSWCVGDDASGGLAVYFGDYSGYVHQYPSTTYYDGNVATSAINAFYQTKWFRYPEAALGDKYFRLLKTYCLTEDSGVFLNAEVRSDYEASGKVVQINLGSSGDQWDIAIWDTDTWSGDAVIIGRNEVNKGKNMFQIKFYNEVVSEGFTILGFENFLEPTKDRI